MKNRSLILLFILQVLFGCENYIPEERNFPILKTLTPVDIDSSGVTFKAEVVRKGTMETTSYGFLLNNSGEPEDQGAYKVVVGDKIEAGDYKVRLDHVLVSGYKYKIRAFATFNGSIVYGDVVKIQSMGSSKCPWSVRLNDISLEGWFKSVSSSTDEKGLIVFQSSHAYEYDPERNEINAISNFPLTGNSGTLFACANLNNSIYFLQNINKLVYEFDNGAWSLVANGQNNLWYNTPYIGISSKGIVYALSSIEAVSFDPSTNITSQWYPLPMSIGGFMGGCQLNDTSYIITTSKELWRTEYPFTNRVLAGTYPGKLIGKAFAFVSGSKIFIGSAGSKDVWIWDTTTKIWSEIDQFPAASVTWSDIFSFTVKSKFYVGIKSNGSNYTILKFDPSKIESHWD
jgi:hypothetical protein